MRPVLLVLCIVLADFSGNAAAQLLTAAPLKSLPCYGEERVGFPFEGDSMRTEWYGNHWEALGESGLCTKRDETRQIFRFVWLPSGYSTVTVILRDFGHKRYELQAKRLDGTGGVSGDPGRLVADTSFPLTEYEWTYIFNSIRRSGYYSEDGIPPGSFGPAGGQWVLEWEGNSSYHYVDRWTPSEYGPTGTFRAVGEWLLRRSKLVPDSVIGLY
jgi:hypothetical protein